MLIKNNSQEKFQKIWALLTWVIVAGLFLSSCNSLDAAQSKTYTIGVVIEAQPLAIVFDAF